MNMKTHTLTALREQFDHWEDLLSNLSDAQIAAPLLPSHSNKKNVPDVGGTRPAI